MDLIDAHDTSDREFAASLQGIDLTKQHSHRPGHTSSQTVVGLQSFYHDWFEKQQGASNGA